MSDSRSDALLLRTLAGLVNTSNNAGRSLVDLDLLEAAFDAVSQRCRSAFNHMTRWIVGKVANDFADRFLEGQTFDYDEYPPN